MLFEEEDAALLKKWIIKRLEDMYVPFFPHPVLFPLPIFVRCSTVPCFGTVAMLIWKNQFRRRFRCSSGLRACLVEARSDAGGGSKVVY